ncbi:MAG TPA: DUF4331 domain-containing protein [Mycobacteriales bacterium]|jgi:hypothetical protein|nr:DUF4331 domain-containing protein [Mycobacteriales bacterium]
MSSHREAPGISKDPVADNTDVYAFVSPDRPDTVTLIANFLPFQGPAGGPNFYEFGDDVLYSINIDRNGDGRPDLSYQFTFETRLRNENTFLYNTGPVTSLDSPNWNRRQFYTVRRVTGGGWGGGTVIGRGLSCPPCNIGPLSTPNYDKLAAAAIHPIGDIKVFAGQRAEGFYVDLGAIFDLGDLRPFQQLHNQFGLGGMPTAAPGVNATKDLNVHSIAVQVPKKDLTGWGVPTNPADRRSVIGVYAAASRQRVVVRESTSGEQLDLGPYVQVSRLGNPLFNEVIVPMAKKDYWNSQSPHDDGQFAKFVSKPELAGLLPTLYPGVFPNLDKLNKSGKARADLLAVLLTGIPSGLIPGFQNNTGTRQADLLRLNMAIPPAAKENIYGLLGGDLAGFPNGRRVADDVTAIELRALAGVTYALVDKTFTPDAAASAVTDGLTPADLDIPYLSTFPYLGVPHSGYSTPAN